MKYPQPRPTSTIDKLTLVELGVLYDELTALGLTVLPKRRDKKIPFFWGKGIPTPSRVQALAYQERPDTSGWCVKTGNGVYVVDIDPQAVRDAGLDPLEIFQQIQALSPSKFVLQSPSNGVHIYYSAEGLGNVALPYKGVDGRGDGGQVVSLGGFNTYPNGASKGVADGHIGTYHKVADGDYSHIPPLTPALRKLITKSHLTSAENYGQTIEGNKRVTAHVAQSSDTRESVVIECLNVILRTWDANKSYDEWVALWMASYSGSKTLAVRDVLLSHENVYWHDDDVGRQHFIETWANHEERTGGYTVATLFYLARLNGWLHQTGLEVPSYRVKNINVRYISHWQETPKRLALQSQTGSGKTQNLISLYEKLGKPKTVVFVPTIKLAISLHDTLVRGGMPTTLYINPTTQRAKPYEELANASVLVTTLQTFAMRVWRDNMASYGLVYIEESDQLIQSFSRGGGGLYPSQVRDTEARKGFACLRDALVNCDYVWAVDATMTQVTVSLMESMSILPVTVVVNQWVEPKATVKMLGTQGDALQTAFDSLLRGLKVVLVCDTAHQALEAYQALLRLGVVDEDKAILVTRETERDARTSQFIQNVNEEALRYNLVVYNSIMGSGVSVSSLTPDVIVQIATYLTPRNNLQLLNRYRTQKDVYCYYRNGESLYNPQAQELAETFLNKANLESAFLQIPLVERTQDATLRAHLATLSIADEGLQNRSPRAYYESLLEKDGRLVVGYGSGVVSSELEYTLAQVREEEVERKKEIRAGWKAIPPIEETNIPPNLTSFEVACGLHHARISALLRGNIPENETPQKINDVAMEFSRYTYPLSALFDNEQAIRKSEQHLTDEGKAITALQHNATILRVVSLVHRLYPDLGGNTTEESIKSKAKDFLADIWANKEAYNSCVRTRQKLDLVYDASNPTKNALAIAKICLGLVGLKQRRVRTKDGISYSISNLESAKLFLQWRWQDAKELTLDNELQVGLDYRQFAITQYDKMNHEDKNQVHYYLRVMDFVEAVKRVKTPMGE